jgi:glycosyltransferase involved in cell wall biosynthesis
MRTVLAYPGNMAHAQHVARAIHEAGCLDAFVTSFAWRRDGRIARLLDRLPGAAADRVRRQLSRRTVEQIPAQLVRSHPAWEIVRTAASLATRNPIPADFIWDHASLSFDALVARHYVPGTEAIHAFEYIALSAFETAGRLGKARVLHLPSLDSRQFEDIKHREKAAWPELNTAHDAYFDQKFQQRYERRRQEIALADVIITNSSLTARSHIEAGADPAKIFAVPLGAPEAIEAIKDDPHQLTRPLNVIWAGPFSLRKGAHCLMESWRALAAGAAANLNIYGQNLLPERVGMGEGMVFNGSVPQPRLFEAYEAADILVFPTLSDGFGMVVAEAMAHGLPVITTDRAGAADFVTRDNGVIVPAGDSSALTQALQWCLDNRLRLAEMRTFALGAARGRQWSHFRGDLIEALDIGLKRAGFQPSFRRPG